jgi:nucleoside 2-deoxyribosyltransferase
MNALKNTRVYLAGNIEYTANSIDWRNHVKEDLTKIGVKVLSPLDVTFVGQPLEDVVARNKLYDARKEGRWEEVHSYMKKVVQKDLRLIDCSDFVIFNLEVTKPTFGTIHELVVSITQKKPIFLVLDKKTCPLWLTGIVSFSDIYDTVDDVLTTIHKINEGILPMDQNKWRILIEGLR